MKKTKYILLLLLIAASAYGQNTTLSNPEISKLFPDSVKKKFNIQYPIQRVNRIKAGAKTLYVLFTATNDSISARDTFHFALKGLVLEKTSTSFKPVIEFSDFRSKAAEESTISFWTKYCAFTDIDQDAGIDPLFVYGTEGANGYDDGRVKILVYYKGKKIALRHQNGVLDQDRSLQVDADFYSLPVSVQDKVKSVMKKIEADTKAIFPGNWEAAMRAKKVKIEE